MNERLNAFESRLGAVEDSVEDLADGKRNAQKMQSDEALKERINEIKPELIKLWSKCDTLDDRIVFNERRAEDRAKVLNGLL
jgi:hypothetical protein